MLSTVGSQSRGFQQAPLTPSGKSSSSHSAFHADPPRSQIVQQRHQQRPQESNGQPSGQKPAKNYGDIEKIKNTLYGNRNKQYSTTAAAAASAAASATKSPLSYSTKNNRQSSEDSESARVIRPIRIEEATPCLDTYTGQSGRGRNPLLLQNSNLSPLKQQQTSICDMFRNPSSESSKQLTFSVTKNFSFQENEKPKGKRRGDEYKPNLDTTIPHLTNKTSQSGFSNDTLGKQFLNFDTLNRTFANLFPHTVEGKITSKERMMNQNPHSRFDQPDAGGLSTTIRSQRTLKQGKGRDHSENSANTRNVITGWNLLPQKRSGIMIVEKQKVQSGVNNVILRNDHSSSSDSRLLIQPQKSASKSNGITNIFFRDDISQKQLQHSTMNQSAIGFGGAAGERSQTRRSESNSKERSSKVLNLRFNSDSMKSCMVNQLENSSQISETRITKERSISRNPINNNSSTMQALMIQPHILARQSSHTQDALNKILSTTDVNKGKLILADRNTSYLTKESIKNETMGTPHRFQLSESSNKISSNHQNNSFTMKVSQTVRHDERKQILF